MTSLCPLPLTSADNETPAQREAGMELVGQSVCSWLGWEVQGGFSEEVTESSEG